MRDTEKSWTQSIGKPFNSDDLQRFIDNNSIEAAILPMQMHTSTVAEAAYALEVDAVRIIKSLVFITPVEPLLVINNGLARIDRRKLALHLGFGRKRIKLANSEQALEITGYIVGAMPPFGHRQKLRTLADSGIPDLETVFGGGGDINAMMRLTSLELLRVTGAEILDISE